MDGKTHISVSRSNLQLQLVRVKMDEWGRDASEEEMHNAEKQDETDSGR